MMFLYFQVQFVVGRCQCGSAILNAPVQLSMGRLEGLVALRLEARIANGQEVSGSQEEQAKSRRSALRHRCDHAPARNSSFRLSRSVVS